MGSRARIARAFGVKPSELLPEVQRRLRNKPEIVEVTRAEAPVQEVVLTGDDADLTKLPVHLQHGADGAPYISASIDYVDRSEDRLDQCRHPPADAARPHARPASISSRRATCARSTRRAPRPASRCRSASWSARIRSITSPAIDAAAGRRARPRRVAARRAAAGGQMRHQRHPRAGRRRIRARGLSRRARPRRAGRAVRRIPRLLRRGEAQSGVPRHRDHASQATRCSRPRPSAASRSAAPTPRSSTALRTEVDDLARARDRGARAGRGLCHAVERRHVQRARLAAPARAGRGAQRHRAPASARSPTSRTCSWSIPTSTSSPTSRWTGRWRRASSPTAT